jgi:hypothetical protein
VTSGPNRQAMPRREGARPGEAIGSDHNRSHLAIGSDDGGGGGGSGSGQVKAGDGGGIVGLLARNSRKQKQVQKEFNGDKSKENVRIKGGLT